MYVVYWSATGNTEAMANAVGEGIGADAKVVPVSEVSVADVKSEDKLALGCPAMGAEVIEEAAARVRSSFCSVHTTGAMASGCAHGRTAWRLPVQ